MPESTGERPTFTQAFASEGTAAESPAATPSTETTPVETASADAIAPPTDSTPVDGATTPAQGPIPYDRHKTVLDGAYKERDTYKQQLDQLSWAQNVDRAAIQEAERLGQLYQRDRAGYIRSLLDEALTDGELAPVLRSEFGRRLAQRTQADAPIEPDIPVHDEQGRLVAQTFSAERVQQIVQRAVAEAIGKEVAPIKQTFANQEAARKAAAEQRELDTRVETSYASLEKLPQFKEHDQAIAQAMQSPEFAGLSGPEQAYAAWWKVVGPKLQASHKAQTLDELKTKAAASTVNPTAAVVATTHRPKSLTDPALQW